MQVAAQLFIVVAQALAPLFLTAMILGVVVNVAQTGPMWATEALKPNFNKLNPLTGLKRFVSPASLVELIKASYKIGLVSYIAWTTIQGSYPKLMLTLPHGPDGRHERWWRSWRTDWPYASS